MRVTGQGRGGWVVAAGMALYGAFFSWCGIMRFLSSHFEDLDVGLFTQSLHTTAWNGLILYNTVEQGSHFTAHNSPIWLLLVPLYQALSSPITLIVLQTLVLAAGAWPVYLLARDRLGEDAGALFGIAYLLNPLLHGVNYDPVHELAFTVTPWLLVWYNLEKERMGWVWAWAGVALLAKEDVSFVWIFFGLFLLGRAWMLRRRNPAAAGKWARHGAGFILVGVGWLVFSLYVVIPHFRAGHASYSFFAERYGALGRSLPEVLWTMISQPWKPLALILEWPRISYVLECLLPLAFLPLAGWSRMIPALPVFAINLLSSFSTMYNSGSRYPAMLIPSLFAAAILGAGKLAAAPPGGTPHCGDRPSAKAGRDEAGRARRRLTAAKTVLAISVVMTLALDPSPARIGRPVPSIDNHQRLRLAFCRRIPPAASVSTQAQFYTHLCRRLDAYVGFQEGVEYLLVDRSQESQTRNSFEKVGWPRDLPALISSGRYRLLDAQDGIELYRRVMP